MTANFESVYPHVTLFVKEYGWIELGYDADSPLTSLLRAVDIGGLVWEGKDEYDSLEDAFGELNTFLETWFQDHF